MIVLAAYGQGDLFFVRRRKMWLWLI